MLGTGKFYIFDSEVCIDKTPEENVFVDSL